MQDNKLSVYNNEQFGQVRTIQDEDGKVLFCGSDVAKALGYSNPSKALTDHCRCITKRYIPHPQNLDKQIEMVFIPEGDIYRLIASSKLPAAEQFERWVFDEVLPTIRKTGGYVANDDLFLETYLPNADESTKMLFKTTLTTMRNLSDTVGRQQAQLEEQKPLVDFANQVASTKDLFTMAEFAKTAYDENIKFGRNDMFKWLRDNNYLRDNNEPYQRYIDMGLFRVKETVKTSPYGVKTFTQTFVTGKGQIYLIEKLRREYSSTEQAM